MRIINAPQGSDEWLRIRSQKPNASEAPAMMSASSKVKRNDLLKEKATRVPREYSRFLEEVVFARGHAVEAQARPIAEETIGEDLFPAFASDDDGRLHASFDGATMDERDLWECKQWNEAKAAEVREGQCPEEDYWQVVHQFAVCERAERCLYMVSDGTEGGTVSCWVERDEDDIARLLAGWAQFERDLAEYTPPEPTETVTGERPEAVTLPVVRVEGRVTESNLDAYREAALQRIQGINEDLSTDQDFADAEAAVKWCKESEEKLNAVKEQVLAQTADIDSVFRTLDEIKEQARAKRLSLDKLVKRRKEEIRHEIVAQARADLQATIDQINDRLGGRVKLPEIEADFGGAIKGKRTVDTLQSAADDELAKAKIRAHELGDRMQAGVEILRSEAGDFPQLFRDAHELAQKEPEDLRALIRSRIAEHQEAEARRQQAEEERKQREQEAEQARQARAAEAAQAKPQPPSEVPSAPEVDGTPSRPVAPKSTDEADERAAAATIYPGTDRVIAALCEQFDVAPFVAHEWIRLAASDLRADAA